MKMLKYLQEAGYLKIWLIGDKKYHRKAAQT